MESGKGSSRRYGWVNMTLPVYKLLMKLKLAWRAKNWNEVLKRLYERNRVELMQSKYVKVRISRELYEKMDRHRLALGLTWDEFIIYLIYGEMEVSDRAQAG